MLVQLWIYAFRYTIYCVTYFLRIISLFYENVSKMLN